MSDIVFVLGAGSSVEAGAPVMADFLDKAFDLARSEDLGGAERHAFDLVKRARDELQAAHSKAKLDINNLEVVFEAFEMVALIGHLGDLSQEEVSRLPEAMRLLITVTLERLIRLPAAGGVKRPSVPHERFAALLKDLKDKKGAWPTVITFNYDLCVDYALRYLGIPFAYHLTDGGLEGVKLLKLHGSLNWAYCAGCESVVGHPLDDHVAQPNLDPAAKEWRLMMAEQARQSFRCQNSCSSKAELMIVPPTWAKGKYQLLLRSVWSAAAAELRAAENIIVCGYSLPETDSFFRHLYAVGSIGEANLRRFWVFDPYRPVEQRFKSFLGQQADARFMFHQDRFHTMVERVREELAR